jgi:hypothetical protein
MFRVRRAHHVVHDVGCVAPSTSGSTTATAPGVGCGWNRATGRSRVPALPGRGNVRCALETEAGQLTSGALTNCPS